MASVKELIDTMTSPTKEDKELISKAYDFAQKAHAGHERYSGEPYFNHLVATAKTLAELGMGPRTISAALLHDSIEDVGIEAEEIEKEFGKEVLFLVQGVTKLGHLKYRGLERHTESLRKLFVATSQDIRVLLIKFADRLHNMQTLEHVPEEKRRRIAMETLEIYAPLAYRLGVRKLHRELEDLAFQHAYPKEYKETEELLHRKRAQMEKQLDKMARSIKKALANKGLRQATTEHRIKGIYSLYQKLKRKEENIENIHDTLALRIIVPTVSDCYTALGIIHGVWQPLPGRIKDYIAFPKPNGYQSLHTTIFTGDGNTLEIQIRTTQMHREAEYGVASHIFYKNGDEEKNKRNPYLSWILQLLPKRTTQSENKERGAVNNAIQVPKWLTELVDAQEEFHEPNEYIRTLKSDFFEHRIFVFTPEGDVVDLPTGSSSIDFAYAIHSDIGDHISGVEVNGKLVSLETVLRNGDVVKILTKESSHPTQKWIDFAKTTLARRHIRAALQQQKTDRRE